MREATGGGAHVSLDALGSPRTAADSVACLRRRGRHVQVGPLLGADTPTPLPMDRVIGWELEIRGSHGMAAHAYPQMIALIEGGRLDPGRLISRRITLEESIDALAGMDRFPDPGIAVIDRM